MRRSRNQSRGGVASWVLYSGRRKSGRSAKPLDEGVEHPLDLVDLGVEVLVQALPLLGEWHGNRSELTTKR